jgi:HNH endonuclease
MLPKPEHEAIKKLDSLLENINEAENHLKELKFQLRYIPKTFSEYNLTQEERLEIAQYLYWLDVKIPKEEIAFNLLRISGLEFSKILNASFSDIKCKVCLEPIVFKSKNAYKEFLNNSTKSYGGECNKCLKNRLESWRVESDNQRKERETQYQINLNKLKSMSYTDYLQTEHWKEVRKKQLTKSGYKCQMCNKGGDLNVHHRTYERRGEEKYEDLIVLCSDCHNLFHNHS